MSEKITYREMKEYAETYSHLTEGESVHIHHCKRGKDNDRLYITRRGDSLLAYCHHCGERGFIRETGGRSLSNLKANRAKRDRNEFQQRTDSERFTLPKDGIGNPQEWPVKARFWLRKYRVTDDEITNYGLLYSPWYRRVIMPVYRDGKLALFQTRRIEDNDDGPKYITYANHRAGFWARCIDPTETLVIVEDMISAIRCARYVDALALLGTHIHSEDVFKILKDRDAKYRKLLIFLDNDNRQVRLAQLKLKEQLASFIDTQIIKENHDPKEFNDSDLKNILLGS